MPLEAVEPEGPAGEFYLVHLQLSCHPRDFPKCLFLRDFSRPYDSW